jgi:3'-5' exoribonuclease
MTRLPRIADLAAEMRGWGFFLCTLKEIRAGRRNDFLVLTLADASGQIPARMFDEVERFRDEFDSAEFVRVEGRVDSFNGQPQFIVTSIRRVHPAQDASQGFNEDDLVPSAPRRLRACSHSVLTENLCRQ